MAQPIRICKSCGSSLYYNHKFCASCGARYVDRRVTMSSIFQDFRDTYLGWDTKFPRTMKAMILHPRIVVDGYFKGTRGKYVDPMRMVIIAVFVGSMLFLLSKHIGMDYESIMQTYQVGPSSEENKKMAQFSQKIYELTSEYQLITYLVTLPLLALVGRLAFWSNKYYNYTEQFVLHMYVYSFFSILSSTISIILMLIKVEWFLNFGFVTLPLLFIYTGYVYKDSLRLSLDQIIIKAIVSMILLSLIFVVFIVAVAVIVVIIR